MYIVNIPDRHSTHWWQWGFLPLQLLKGGAWSVVHLKIPSILLEDTAYLSMVVKVPLLSQTATSHTHAHSTYSHKHAPTHACKDTSTRTHAYTHTPYTPFDSWLLFSFSSWEWSQNDDSYSTSGERSEMIFNSPAPECMGWVNIYIQWYIYRYIHIDI